MKRLKISFMIFILIITLIGCVNLGVVNLGKETKAYSIEDTMFASGMDLYFIRNGTKPYGQTLLDVSVWENHGYPKPVTTPYTGPELTYGRYGYALEFNPDIPQTFYSSSDDGYTFNINTTYLDGWNDGTAQYVFDNITVTRVGQVDVPLLGYQFYRTYLFFDTSAIDESLTIDSATLRLYGQSNNSQTDFNVTIQNGQPTYPHIPITLSDYNRSYYSGDGGKFDTSSLILNGWNDIELTNTSWINATGITKLALRSDREINGTVPTQEEYVTFSSGEGSYPPQLIVEYLADDYVLIPDSDSLDLLTDELTVEMWINPSETYEHGRPSQWYYFIHRSQQFEFGWQGWDDKLSFKLWNNTGDAISLKYNMNLTQNTWYHFGGVLNSTGGMQIYLNGELVADNTDFTGTLKSSGDVGIGASNAGDSGWIHAIIDEVRIYPIALTQEDIKHDMFTPIQKYRTNWFKESYNEDDGWSEGLFDTDYVRFINNDPDLPYTHTDGTKTNVIIESIRYIPGFQNYRFYCTLNTSGLAYAEPDTSWEWEFELFRHGVKETAFLINITLVGITVYNLITVEYYQYYNNGWNLKQAENLTYAYGGGIHKFDIIVDAWVGVDRHHFSTRVSVDAENRSGTIIGLGYFANTRFSSSYGFELVDNDNNPRILDWYDGFVIATLRVNNYGEDFSGISDHGLLVTIAVIIIAVVVTALAYQYVVRPILSETFGFSLPGVPGLPEEAGDLIHGLISAFTTALKPIVDALTPIVTAIMKVVNPIIQGFINFMGDILTALINVATSLWDIIVSAIDSLLYAIFPGLGPVAFSTFLTAIVDFLVGLFSWIVTSLANLVTFLTSTFSFFGEVLTKMFNTISTAVGYWVTMLQNIWSMLEGGLGTGMNIWETLDLATWVIIIAILYPVYLFGMWETQGIDAVLKHLTMITNIFSWIFSILLTVVQSFITVTTSIIEALPGE